MRPQRAVPRPQPPPKTRGGRPRLASQGTIPLHCDGHSPEPPVRAAAASSPSVPNTLSPTSSQPNDRAPSPQSRWCGGGELRFRPQLLVHLNRSRYPPTLLGVVQSRLITGSRVFVGAGCCLAGASWTRAGLGWGSVHPSSTWHTPTTKMDQSRYVTGVRQQPCV